MKTPRPASDQEIELWVERCKRIKLTNEIKKIHELNKRKEFDERVKKYMEATDIEALIGLVIREAKINEEKDLIILDTNKGLRYLTWEGECCSVCFLAHVSGADNLIGAEILDVYESEWKEVSSNDEETLESMGINIKTNKGYITFETRLEHNGAYSGDILISSLYPLDGYYNPRYAGENFPVMKKLEDF